MRRFRTTTGGHRGRPAFRETRTARIHADSGTSQRGVATAHWRPAHGPLGFPLFLRPPGASLFRRRHTISRYRDALMVRKPGRSADARTRNWIPASAGTPRNEAAVLSRHDESRHRNRALLEKCGHGRPLLDDPTSQDRRTRFSPFGGAAIQDGSQKQRCSHRRRPAPEFRPSTCSHTSCVGGSVCPMQHVPCQRRAYALIECARGRHPGRAPVATHHVHV